MASKEQIKSKKLFYLYLGIRIFSPFLMWVDPLIGFIINFLLDARDGYHAARAGYTRLDYTLHDKLLDYWFYIVLLVYIFMTPAYVEYQLTLLGLFIFRSIGQGIHAIIHDRRIFLIFANYFESTFLLVMVANYLPDFSWILTNVPVVFGFMLLRLLSEYVLHIWNYPIIQKLFRLDMEWVDHKKQRAGRRAA